jgi:pSer/pThr/pTyr-binding forkhead associated (FHA) protein
MALITLQVLDGANRGSIFGSLPTPVTIGREEGNTVQLNDERVSRYHLKIQEDHDKVVLTDLESTNGTKVNGEEIQLRILRYGDLITIGRSVLLFGSREQIAQRLAHLRATQAGGGHTSAPSEVMEAAQRDALDFELNWPNPGDVRATLHAHEPPELPERLTPGQAAQLAEMLEFVHIRLRHLIQSVQADEQNERVTLDYRRWQSLLDLQWRLASYLKQIAEPRDVANEEV